MKIPLTLQPLPDTGPRGLPTLLQHLRVGQVFPARVLEQLQPGLLRMQIATTTLLARSPLAMQAGTTLRLEVVKTGQQPELRILRAPDPIERRQHAVRAALARELPPGELRQAATRLTRQAPPGREGDAVRQFSAILDNAGVRPNQLNPTQLRRALATSGILHEARLAGHGAIEQADTKTRLLQLMAVLRPESRGGGREGRASAIGDDGPAASRSAGGDALLSRLIRLIEGAVSRIQLHQAAVLPTEDGQRQAWQIDLPIRLPDETSDAMLRIERDDSGDADTGSPGWSVNLVFQFDTIGTLQCRIGLAGERVSATFWCERDDTWRRVEARLPSLQAALEAQGLEVVHIAGVLGAPPEPLVRVPVPDSLLDERA